MGGEDLPSDDASATIPTGSGGWSSLKVQGVSRWEGPLFIVGMPRSGTKLLRSLLTQHSGIAIPAIETEFLPFLANWVSRYGFPESEEKFERLYLDLRTATYFKYRDLSSRPFSWRDWRAACAGRFSVGGLFEGFMRYELGVALGDGKIWGDKSPGYICCIDLILQEFQSARVIHIVRDVRDYCVSIRKAWGKDVRRAAYRWRNDVLAADSECATNASRCMQIKYEDLLRAPEETLLSICNFLEIDFQRKMLVLERASENIGDAKGRKSIVADNSGKFRSALSAREIRHVEALAWDAMLKFGYTPEVANKPMKLGALSMMWRKLKDGVNLIVRDVEGRGLISSMKFYMSHHRLTKWTAEGRSFHN